MTAGLRILALVGDAWGGRGGIAQYNRDFLGALAGAGFVGSIDVLPRHVPDTAAPPLGVRQHPARPGRLAYAVSALWAALSRPIDVVFCGHLYMAPLAAVLARLRRARLVVQTHGIEAWPRPSRPRRAAVEAADLVLAVSRYTRARVLGWAAIAPERARVIPNTVDEVFTPGDGSALRERWNLVGRKVLLTVGRMDARERYKGHDRVIRAMPALLAGGQDVVYVVLGEGDDQPRLQALADELGLADRVRFMGAIDRGALVQAYRAADLFVMPSTGEGFGIAYLEAMACGTPALGLDVAGASDALAQGELGRVVPQDNDLGRVIATELDFPRADPDNLSRIVRRRFGPAAYADRLRPLSSLAPKPEK
jgi:phosphatidylinositol alpha-1,6-mannosyltransferase